MLAFLVSEASLILPSADPSSPFAAERLATVWLTPSTLPDRRVAMLEARMTGLGGSVALLSRLAQAQGQAAFRRRAGSLPTSLVQALALRAARQWLLDDLVEHLGPSLRLVLATGDRPLDRTTRIFQAAGVPLVRALASRRTAGLLSCESPWDADGGDLGELGEEWRHEVTDAGDLLIRGAGCLTGRVKDPRGYEALCFAGWTRAGMRVELEGRRVRAVRPEESPEEAPWPVTDWAAKLCEMGGVTGVTRLEGVGLFIEAPARTPGLNWWGGGAEPLTRGVPHPAVTRRLLDLLGTPDAEREVLAWHVLDRLPRTSLGALDTRTLRREFPLLSKGKP